MDLLVVTNTCSAKKNLELNKKRKKRTIDPQQKFFRLFIEGLNYQQNVNVTVLSALPVSASTVEQKKFEYEEESVGNICYHYIPFRNGKISRYVTLATSAYKETKKWCRLHKHSNSEATIIVDVLAPMIAIPTRIVAQCVGIKVGAIITDIPSLCTNMKEREESSIKTKLLRWYQQIADKDMHNYDYYIPLTQSLNEVVNRRNKPYCVVEGFADEADKTLAIEHENYIMYAGGIYEKYGLEALIDAFIKLNRQDLELWIFGEGTYVEKIKEINKEHSNIIYKGCVTAEEIVDFEKKALLLVNPRPTNETFAKFSFPSKTMEYLLSGTPVLSTRLPGIPEEYFDYLYAIEGDSADAIERGLRSVLNLDKIELEKRGKQGHNFVLNNKNNKVMTAKIIKLMQEVVQ